MDEHAQASPSGSDYTEAGRQPSADQAQIEDLRFEAIRNGRYHLARRSWYEWLHRLSMFVVVMAGATAVTDIAGQQKYLVLVATAAGIVDLVFQFGERGAQHARLQELSYEILSAIDEDAENKESAIRRARAALARLYASEPKTMRVVDALAYNDTKEGLEKDCDGDLIVLRRRHRWLRHVFAFDGLRMQQAKELPAGKLPDGWLLRLWKRWSPINESAATSSQ